MNLDTEDELFGELAAMRPAQKDAFAASLKATVRRRLLGAAGEPFRLGRFTVLEPLGSGGMGVVFLAYDPDLDRKIALKVLRSGGERGRREVLREGRALARLKHPNVVAVYEVGELDDSVFVAMEYVEGDNLREWLKRPRGSEAIVALLIAAGRGLAAAHAVGLIHRDFKPDNVVIDAAGHARVIDFGMARLHEDQRGISGTIDDAVETTASVHGGTPAYMAPERLAGRAGEQAADQYAFCVTCWEALVGTRPVPGKQVLPHARGVPGWLRRVIERGLAKDPASRWPSMAALLAALGRGKTRVRARRATVVVLVIAALVLAVEGLRRRDVAQRVATCEAAGAAIDEVWGDEARQGLRAAFMATGVGFAGSTIERVIPRLDEQAEAWRAARTDACRRVEVERRWSTDTYDRAVFCLEDRQMELAALVTEFGRADATTVRKAVSAVGRLKTPAACLDEGLLQRLPGPPTGGYAVIQEVRAEMSRATSLGLAGKFPEALAAARRARERADGELAGSPLWAAARAQEGNYLDETGAYPEAEVASAEAYFAAARVGAWAVAADTATRLIGVVGIRQARKEEGREWASHAEVAVVYAGDESGMAEARRITKLATLHEESGAYAEALALHEQALGIWERAMGPDHPEVAIVLNNLGNVRWQTGEYTQARALYVRALAVWERTLGPDHPAVATGLASVANVEFSDGAYAEARVMFERALAITVAAQGPDHPNVGGILNNLGAVYGITGENARARAAFERVLAIDEKTLGPDHPAIGDVLVNIAAIDRQMGAYASARALIERALPIQEKGVGAEHPTVANTLVTLANVCMDTGEVAQAQRLYERALAIQDKALGADHPLVAVTLVRLGNLHIDAHRPREALPLALRAVAIVDKHEGVQNGEFAAHFALARALMDSHGDASRALAEARTARDGYRDSGEMDPGDLASTEAWIVAHTPVR